MGFFAAVVHKEFPDNDFLTEAKLIRTTIKHFKEMKQMTSDDDLIDYCKM